MSTETKPKNPNAVALGKMGRGIKKTITPALIARNKRAAKFPRPSRRKENQLTADEHRANVWFKRIASNIIADENVHGGQP